MYVENVKSPRKIIDFCVMRVLSCFSPQCAYVPTEVEMAEKRYFSFLFCLPFSLFFFRIFLYFSKPVSLNEKFSFKV